jgi:hypothetical protein
MKSKTLLLTLFSISIVTLVAQAQTVTISDPIDGIAVAGPDVTISWSSEAIDVQDADGESVSGVGHYHVILLDGADAALSLPAGQPIPQSDTMIHTTDTSHTFTSLAAGDYTAYVVVGDGQHSPLQPSVQAVVRFHVINLTFIEPAHNASIWGKSANFRWVSEGVSIESADGLERPGVAHYHLVLVKRRNAKLNLEVGQPIPRSDTIVHITDREYRFEDLTPGPYTLFLVLGDGAHIPQDPPVATSIQFQMLEVEAGAGTRDVPWWVIALVVGGIAAGVFLIQRL